MKRLVCTALLIGLFAAPQVQAQSIDLGVKGGVNVATVSTDIPDIEDIKESQTGFVGGAFVAFGLGSVFSLQPELLYSQKGFAGQEGELEANLRTNYIEIPLLLKANLDAGMLRPAIYAGPVVSFESSCDLTVESFTVDCDEDEEGFADRKSTDWGVDFGANLDIFVGPVMLVADIRYQLGLTNLVSGEFADEESVKTRAWQFMAGIGLSL
jgi:hypothetical protein